MQHVHDLCNRLRWLGMGNGFSRYSNVAPRKRRYNGANTAPLAVIPRYGKTRCDDNVCKRVSFDRKQFQRSYFEPFNNGQKN